VATRTCRSRSGSAALSYRATMRFVWAPTDLILNYRTRPVVAAVYAALARLCEVAKGSVAVSRADLAHWCGAEREDAMGVAIEKAIRVLRAGGWLIQSEGEGRKRRLVVAWGFGQDGQPRPWRFDRPDRARPAALQVVAMPLALFDWYLGRLRLDPHAPAAVERYFDRPLLDFADIGSYAVRQLGNVPVTPQLVHLGLVSEQGVVRPPPLDEFLALAADGHLTTCAADGTIIAVRLSPAGEAQLRKQRTPTLPSPSDEPDGSVADPTDVGTGSVDGSEDSEAHFAFGRDGSAVFPTGGAAWERDGMNQRTKGDPSPDGDIYPTREAWAGGFSASHLQDVPYPPTTAQPLPQAVEDPSSPRDNDHLPLLDPMIVAGHQALNSGRAIPAAEWWGMLALQQEHGREVVLHWQLRAASAGRQDVRLAYYLACAAETAFGATSGRGAGLDHRSATQLPSTDSSAAAAMPSGDTRPRRPPSQPKPSGPPLDPNRAVLLAGIEQLIGRTVRHPERMAEVPLVRLVRWRAIADHPGLQLWDDPLGYLIAEAAAGNDPPSVAELNVWAERAGVHWADPRLATGHNEVNAWAEDNTDAPAEAEAAPIGGAETLPIDRTDGEQPENTILLHSPPMWIDATIWRELDSGLRDALAGSVLAPDGGLDVRVGMYERICTCFAAPVRELLHAAHARASPT
jgi:hypothetical protein